MLNTGRSATSKKWILLPLFLNTKFCLIFTVYISKPVTKFKLLSARRGGSPLEFGRVHLQYNINLAQDLRGTVTESGFFLMTKVLYLSLVSATTGVNEKKKSLIQAGRQPLKNGFCYHSCLPAFS